VSRCFSTGGGAEMVNHVKMVRLRLRLTFLKANV
jgi:hypothetical protein